MFARAGMKDEETIRRGILWRRGIVFCPLTGDLK